MRFLLKPQASRYVKCTHTERERFQILSLNNQFTNNIFCPLFIVVVRRGASALHDVSSYDSTDSHEQRKYLGRIPKLWKLQARNRPLARDCWPIVGIARMHRGTHMPGHRTAAVWSLAATMVCSKSGVR